MTNVATLQTAADLSASITAQGISSLVPAGVILAFGGATAPTGWLLCEGALVSRTTYANLYAAILNAHGSGDGTTTFALPDYRGRFIRGRDNAAARDPDRAARTAAATGGATADAVGSVQSNATSRPTTAFTTTATNSGGVPASSGVSTVDQNNSGGTPVGYNGTGYQADIKVLGGASGGTTHYHSLPALTVGSGGDNETRPLNAYVNYIIKI